MTATTMTPQMAVTRFKALGEEKRLGILRSLGAGECCACDLSGCCEDSQPLLSFHLRALREAGLVQTRREGRWVHYRLDRDGLRELASMLEAIAEGSSAEGPAGCCTPPSLRRDTPPPADRPGGSTTDEQRG